MNVRAAAAIVFALAWAPSWILAATGPAPAPVASRTTTIVVCASNTSEAQGCDITTSGTADQKSINAVIASCSATNGCKVVLRNGAYNISGPIVIDRSFMTLEGESWPFWGGYVRQWTGPSAPVSMPGTQGTLIRATATGFNLIEIRHHNLPDNGEQRHRGIRIANLYLIGRDYSNNCIDSLTSGNHQDDSGAFENLTLTRCAYGLYISVDNGYINKNNLQDLATGGAFISGANSRFIDNIVWDVGGRGLLTAVRGMVIAGNTFGDTAGYSIDAQGPGVAVITGNGFGPTGPSANGSAIFLACSGCVVSGNYFDATTGSYRAHRRAASIIKVANPSATNNVIVGNSFIPAGTEPAGVYAIDVTASKGNVVLGNSISPGFNNGAATTVHAGVGNLVSLNGGDVTALARAGQTINFQPGPLTAVTNTKGGFSKFVQRALVDNIVVSAIAFSCSVEPRVTLYECGKSSTCENPSVIGSAALMGAGKVADGAVTDPVVGAGDYVAWGLSGGTCSELNLSASAQTHFE